MAYRHNFDYGRPRFAGQYQRRFLNRREEKDVFQVQRAYAYNGPAPVLEAPKTVGCYSVDGDREFGYDRSMLHYLNTEYLPETKMNVNLDLNKELEKAIPYKGTPHDRFEHFLQWVMNKQDTLASEDNPQRLSADVLGARGMFKIIMRTPYCHKVEWSFFVTEFKESFYISGWKNEEKVVEDPKMLSNISLWGHKFEQYMKGDPNEGFDANEEFRCVMNTSLGDHKFLFAAEVDCVDPALFEEDYEDLSAFVTVKCCREVTPERLRNHRRYKLNEWWLENLFIGVPRTIVGFRNDDGIVHTLELLENDDIPEKAGNEWEPNVHFNFLNNFLNFMKKKVREDTSAVYKFEYKTNDGIRCTKLPGANKEMLLPPWYMDGLFDSDDSSDEE